MGIFDIFKRKQMDMQTTQPVENKSITQPVSQPVQNTISTNISGNFVMEIENVFTITGRGTIVTGRVLKGRVDLNDMVTISEIGKTVVVSGIEQFRKILDYAQEGDNAGILLKDVSRNEVSRGMHLVK